MTTGLTNQGFIAKRLIDIQQDLADALTSTFGEVDTTADSVFGQIIGVLSKPLADLWEQLELVYFSQYPDTATGVPLDYAVALSGITREAATFSQGSIGLKGTDGIVVPALTQVSQKSTGILFQTKADVTITLTDITKVLISIDKAVEGETYTLSVDENSVSYTATGVDTVLTIAAALVSAINTDITISAIVEVVDNEDGSFTMTTKTLATTFTVDSANMSWWILADIIALDKGAISAPAGTIVEIVNAVSGLDAVYNFADIGEDSGMGRNIESDEALRLRRLAALRVAGAASVEAIRARILNDVFGVSACIVIENVTDAVDGNGLDPHSIKVIVEGGVDLDIGKMIWAVKAGGIKVMGGVGAVPVTFTDSQGNTQTISFFRPITKYAWVDVVIQESDPLLLPSGYASQIQNDVLTWGKTHTIGQEIVFQQLYGVIYQVPGILKAQVKIALTDNPGDSPSWVTDNISVPSTSYAEFALSRITVI